MNLQKKINCRVTQELIEGDGLGAVLQVLQLHDAPSISMDDELPQTLWDPRKLVLTS